MGCHTWFYRKLNPQPTQDEIRESVIKDYDYVLQCFLRYRDVVTGVEKNPREEDLDCLESYPEWKDLREIEYTIKLYSRLLQKIKLGKAEKAIRKRYSECVPIGGVIRLFRDEYYHNRDENRELIMHDIFRVSNYPPDVLTSYDDFVKFFEDPEKNCYWDGKKSEVYDKIKSFFTRYPDGIIDFG